MYFRLVALKTLSFFFLIKAYLLGVPDKRNMFFLLPVADFTRQMVETWFINSERDLAGESGGRGGTTVTCVPQLGKDALESGCPRTCKGLQR